MISSSWAKNTGSGSLRTLAAVAVVGCLLVAAPQPALAGDGASSAAAQALFEEGKKLVQAKSYAAACPKFAESHKIDPGAGTLLHLGNCYEQLGKSASAWATYIEAASAARAQGRADWAENAKQRAAAIEPKLAKVTVVVSDHPQGLEVRRDSQVLAEGSFGTAIPVDPGEHTFEATAPKKKKWRQQVIVREGTKAEVTVPSLVADPDGPAGPVAPGVPADAGKAGASGGGARTAGFVLAGVGVLGLGIGGVTGVMALGRNSRSKELCPADGACSSAEGVDANASAKTLGTISTVGLIAGGAVLVTGLVLILVGGGKTEIKSAVRLVPSVAPDGSGLLLSGVFQ